MSDGWQFVAESYLRECIDPLKALAGLDTGASSGDAFGAVAGQLRALEGRAEVYEQALRVIAAKPDAWQGELAQKTLDTMESS